MSILATNLRFKSIVQSLIYITFALAPTRCLSAEQVPDNSNIVPQNQETEPLSVEEQARNKIIELEAELIILKRSLGMDRQNKKILIPKTGIYIQGDIGIQQREFAGENGITNLTFDPGLYGGAGLGYRYDRNFRF